MDLFDYMREKTTEQESPLAARLRPRTLDEVVGQQHIIGRNRLLYRAIKADKLGSVIFYGPPGTGKTTLARVIANTTRAEFRQINATSAGKKDMEEVVTEAQNQRGGYGRKTILFIDEIHRFNKGQQDYLLPYVEDGTITLIGATTENPYFEVNSALISRSMIFELHPLTEEDVRIIINRAVYDKERGMGAYHAVIDEDAAAFLAEISNGDARHALNAVELAVLTTDRTPKAELTADVVLGIDAQGQQVIAACGADGVIHITQEVASECIQKRVIRYDKKGDNHYDTISAFIKSMRGSDPDAAVYYMARMMEAGEEPEFIARRIMICAAEDVGNADPNALRVATIASLAAERIGWPEAQIILAQAAEYVATAPKSNTAVESIFAAKRKVKETGNLPIPPYLQDAHYKASADLGRGIGYEYAHEYEEHYSGQRYLPEALAGMTFYTPSENGYEQTIRQHMYHLTGQAKYAQPEHLSPRNGAGSPGHEAGSGTDL